MTVGTRHKLAGAVVVLFVGLVGCTSSGTEIDSSAPRAPAESTAPDGPAGATDDTGEGSGNQVVRYGPLELTVPVGWTVYDLSVDPSTCVRFDVHAVYLGSPSPDMECPAQVIGRADALLIEPTTGSLAAQSAGEGNAEVVAAEVNGLAVEIDDSRSVEHERFVTVPAAGVTITLSFGDTDAVAQQIVQSMRMVG